MQRVNLDLMLGARLEHEAGMFLDAGLYGESYGLRSDQDACLTLVNSSCNTFNNDRKSGSMK